MKFALLLVVICTFPNLFAQVSGNSQGDEQAIRNLEKEMLTAYYKGDVQSMSRIEADDFTVASEEGEETKQEQLENVRKRQPANEHETFDARSWKVRFFGPVAVVEETGVNHSTEPGKNDPTNLIITTVWVNRNGRWQAERMQYSELKEDK